MKLTKIIKNMVLGLASTGIIYSGIGCDPDGKFSEERFYGIGLRSLINSESMPVIKKGDLLMTSYHTDNILRYDGETGEYLGEFVSTNSGGLDGPFGMTYGPDGNLYVVSQNNAKVLRYDGRTGEAIDVFNNPGGGPDNLTFGPDGSLYVSIRGGPIKKFDGTTGVFIEEFVDDPRFGGPLDMVFGPDRNLYVSSENNHSVLRFNGETGNFIDEFVSSKEGGLNGPDDLTFASDGNLYVSGIVNNSVLRYDRNTGEFIDEFTEAGSGLFRPWAFAFSPKRKYLYVSKDLNDESIFRYNGETGEFIDEFIRTEESTLDGVKNIISFGVSLPLEAIVDVLSDTINLHGGPYWPGINTRITMPEGYNAKDIVPGSVEITDVNVHGLGVGQQGIAPYYTGDTNFDTLPDAIVRFNKDELTNNLTLEATIKIEGDLITGEHFFGSDTVNIE